MSKPVPRAPRTALPLVVEALAAAILCTACAAPPGVETRSAPRREPSVDDKHGGLVQTLSYATLPVRTMAYYAANDWDWYLDNVKLEGTAGAGFAGLHIAEQLEQPILAPCATAAPCAQIASDTSVLLRANRRYSWRPAISTGIAAHVHSSHTSDLGWGIGAHMVFMPNAAGQTSPFPAATLHIGDHSSEAFVGVIFSPTDAVQFPNGRDTLTVYRTTNSPAPIFVVPGLRRSSHLYAGLQINGLRQSENEAQAATGAPPSSVVDFKLLPDTLTLKKGEKKHPPAVVLLDAAGAPVLAYARVTWAVGNSSVAELAGDGQVLGKSPGTTELIARVGDMSKAITLIVDAKP